MAEEERPEAEKEKSPDDDAVENDTIGKKQADTNKKAGEAPEEKPADGREAEVKPDTKDASSTENPAEPGNHTSAKPESSNAADTGEKAGNNHTGENNAQSNSSAGSSGENNSSDKEEGTNTENTWADTQPSQPEAPAHEHVWQEHTATRQEWVPNIVVVDDYETKYVEVYVVTECNCGAILTSSKELDDHGYAHLLAGEPTNHWGVPVYEEQQVKVGSHEEDHGYYETVTYVDYYYCECGATK